MRILMWVNEGWENKYLECGFCSWFCFTFAGSHVVSSSVEKIEVVDEGNKTVEYSVTGVDIIKYYKSFKAKINVIPKVNGSLVKWSCEYEKASEEIPDPTIVKDFAANIFQRLDAFILNA